MRWTPTWPSAIQLPNPRESELSDANRRRREDKPKWWEVFGRTEMSDDELFDDLACLGQLQRVEGSEHRVKRSTGIRYRFDRGGSRPRCRSELLIDAIVWSRERSQAVVVRHDQSVLLPGPRF